MKNAIPTLRWPLKELRLATSGRASLTLTLFGKTYYNTYMDVMANTCADVILGKHETVKFEFGGNEGVLSVPAKTHNYVSLAATAGDCRGYLNT